jgi:hypothetical protein
MTHNDLRIYDNNGQTFDRYTVVYMNLPESREGEYSAVGMSENPFSPSGFGLHVIASPGRHLGKRIRFEDLPMDCRKLIQSDIDDINKNLEENGTFSNRGIGL